VRIALAQVNTTVGDFGGNAEKIVAFARQAREAGAGLVVFPELSVCGYPPRDLVEKPAFIARSQETVSYIAEQTRGIAVICGLVTPARAETGKSVMNSAVLLRDGKVEFQQSKMLLPTYDVFDELRNFAPASEQHVFPFCGGRMALTICEDAWNDKQFWNRRLYGIDPVEELMKAGGTFVVNISASPFYVGKLELRRQMLMAIARRYNVPVLMANQVGGNDSLLFDGSSIAVAPDGRVVAQAKSFEEDIIVLDIDALRGDIHEQPEDGNESAYAALVMGTRDYVHKCGFHSAIIGLSGGIDSALTACIAVDALGAQNVTGVAMPSAHSSRGSVEDARALAQNLGVRFEVIDIQPMFATFRAALRPVFANMAEDATEENLQSRIRGTVLMALSNKFGALVLSTGNKSEMAVGYCTLYGDMAGGLAVISDVPKTMVYRLSRYVNAQRERIPQSTIDKPPSAELRPGQLDTDSLPPYSMLDPILEDYIEDAKTAPRIAQERGVDEQLVREIIRIVERSEYKRQQAAPGLKITEKAFGMGRRFPVAARYEV
jgi:NAD+ synthase (glutamine-hydrolysing)